MKKLIFPIAALLMLASCSNENEAPEMEANTSAEITSDLSTQNFIDICSQIESEVASRSDNDLVLTEAIAKEKLEPLVLDGRNIQKQMIKQENLEMLSDTEREYISALSDEECATLSFVYHTIINNTDDEIINMTDPELNKAYSITSDRLLSCAGKILISTCSVSFSMNGVINAKTVAKALLQIGRRYLGYISIAYAIYEFYNCIS